MVSWYGDIEANSFDIINFIEKALGPFLTSWQKLLVVHVDEQKRELIFRIPHHLVPKLKQLSNNPIRLANNELQLRVLYVSGTLRSIKEKLSKMHTYP